MGDLQGWSSKLKNCTLSVLPFDFVRPADGKIVEAVHSVKLNSEQNESVIKLASHVSATGFQTVLAAFVTLVFRLTGDEDIVVGTNTVNYKPYVLRTPITGQKQFKELAQEVSVIATVRRFDISLD
jgi:L-aminoadipate-semialdehyde dehydrogenase